MTCHCTVVDHPAGSVWVAHSIDRTCGQHVHGERWNAHETRATAPQSAARRQVAPRDTRGAAGPSQTVFEKESAK
jgi:hypothetical protein